MVDTLKKSLSAWNLQKIDDPGPEKKVGKGGREWRFMKLHTESISTLESP